MAEQTYALAKDGIYGQANGAYADALSAIPDSGVTRWEWEDDSDTTTAVDSWGSNAGSITGATYVSDPAYGSLGLDLDGTDDTVEDSDFPLITSNEVTIVIFAKPDVTHDARVFHTDESGSWGQQRIQFNSDGSLTYQIGDGSGSSGSQITRSSYDTDQYVMLAMTANENTGEFTAYYNDTEVGTNTEWGAFGPATAPLGIGADIENSRNYFDGTVDDFRYYSTELSQSELSDIYANSTAP